MKKVIIIFILIIMGFSNLLNAQAPNWLWAKSAGGINIDNSYCVSTDSNGNVFMTGYFYSPTIVFGTTILTNADTTGATCDVFIVKYDALGNVLWAKGANSSSSYDEGYSVCTDASGNVIMSGWFASPTITFGATTLTNGGLENFFIVKYDPNGNVIWAESATGTVYGEATSVSTDANGNVYMTGFCDGSTVTFGSITLNNPAGIDLFIVKYDSSGNVLWAESATGTVYGEATSVSTDANGNAFIAGSFTSYTLTFGTITLTNAGGADIFIVKYDSSGNVLWAKSTGGLFDDIGHHVSTDVSGNVYMTGYFSSTSITFGADTLDITDGDVFIVKYDANGNVLWANSGSGYGRSYGVTSDVSGNVFITGFFQSNTITFGNITLTGGGLFIVKYDTNGNVLWAKSDSCTEGIGISTDINGNVLITGIFGCSTIIFGSTTLINNNPGINHDDIFIAKLGNTVGLDQPSELSVISISPNPFTFETTLSFKEEQKNTSIKIADVLGNEIKTTAFSGRQFVIEKGEMKAGIYFVQAIDENKNVVNKKIVIQ